MSNIVSNNYTGFQVFPKYVIDETLKQASYVNDNGDLTIRTSFVSSAPDLSEIESRIGAKTEGKWNNTVDTNPGSIISILKNIDNKLSTPIPKLEKLKVTAIKNRGTDFLGNMLQLAPGTNTITIPSGKMCVVIQLANDGNIQFRSIGNCGNSGITVGITPEQRAYYHVLNFTPSSYWDNGLEICGRDSTNTEVVMLNINSGRTYSYTGRLEDAAVLSSRYFTIPYLNM